jgi:competence protein ComEC
MIALLRTALKLKTLWPDEQYGHYENLSDNDRSLVSLVEFAGIKILLCSDIEQFAQKELLRLYPDLKADIVVAPHHGSTTTLDLEFLEHLDADVLICSCSRKQYEKKNSNTESMKYFPTEARLLCTPETGAIIISVDKFGVIQTKVFTK